MSDTYSPFVKFTYTLLDLDGRPQKKSWMLNLSKYGQNGSLGWTIFEEWLYLI